MPFPSAKTATFNTMKDWITDAQLRGRGRVVMNCVWRMGAHGNRVSNTMSKNSHHTSSEIQTNIKEPASSGLTQRCLKSLTSRSLQTAKARRSCSGRRFKERGESRSVSPWLQKCFNSFMRLESIWEMQTQVRLSNVSKQCKWSREILNASPLAHLLRTGSYNL